MNDEKLYHSKRTGESLKLNSSSVDWCEETAYFCDYCAGKYASKSSKQFR